MDRVNIEIGATVFDRADYDAESDVLYLHVGDPRPAEGEETPEGHVVRFAPGTHQVVGLTLLSPRKILQREGRVAITVSKVVEKTADDLAPAFAAV
jgi:uncharacterized protein YuzE